VTVDYTQPPVIAPPPAQQQPQKSSGCFKWGCIGCAALLLFGALCIAGVAVFVVSAIKSSDVYRGAVHRVERDPRVIQSIGSPVESGWWLTGNVHVNERGGDADFTFPVHGPNGRGLVREVANRESGNWIYSELTFTPSNGSPIDLLKP
jgi:hypothetical protein